VYIRFGRSALKHRKPLNITLTTEPPIKCGHNDVSYTVQRPKRDANWLHGTR
jgi:hypothetical protein